VNIKNGKVTSAIGGAVAALLIVACTAAANSNSAANETSDSNPNSGGCNQNCDLNNIGSKYPDYFNLFMDADKMPTIGMMCVGGAGIMVTSRDNSPAAARPMPEWDAFCKTQIGSRFSVTGNQDDEPRYNKVP
jgi:hypothetical protein